MYCIRLMSHQQRVLVARPTRQDAELLFKLIEISPELREARKWFLREFAASSYEEFKKKSPEGSVEYAHMTALLGFFETLAVLITHGLLSEDLVFDLDSGLALIGKRSVQLYRNDTRQRRQRSGRT